MRTDIANSITADYIVTEVLSDTYDDSGILREKCFRWLFRIWTRLNLSMFRTSRIVKLPIAPGTKTMMLPVDYQDFLYLSYPDDCGNWKPIAINRNLMQQIGIEGTNVCETCGQPDLCSIDMERFEETVIIDGIAYPKTTTRLIREDGSYTEEVTEPVVQYFEKSIVPQPPEPPDPGDTQLHAVQIDADIPIPDKINIIRSLNVNAVRMAIYINGALDDTATAIPGMAAYKQYKDNGIKVMLQINWQQVAGTPHDWPTDMALYTNRLNIALQQIASIGAPEVIAIENEYFNDDYHTDITTIGVNQYIDILTTAVPLVHARGYKVIDSGMNTAMMGVICYRQLVNTGQTDLAEQFAAVAFSTAAKQAIDDDNIPEPLNTQINDSGMLMNTIVSLGCDYLNLHYYELTNPHVPPDDANANLVALQILTNFFDLMIGTKMILAEYGIQNNTQTALVTSLLDAVDSIKGVVMMASFFSGAAGEPAIALCDPDTYALTDAGNAFAAWHLPATVRKPRAAPAATVEMQTTTRVVCQLDKSCTDCVPASPGNLQLLSGCGCTDALCGCCSDDMLAYPVKPSSVHYNLFEQEGFIQFNPGCCISHAILKYVSSGVCVKGIYYFPIAAMETLIAGTYYRSIEKKRNVPQVEKDRARRAYTAERKDLLRDFTKLSYQEWLEMIYTIPRIPTL